MQLNDNYINEKQKSSRETISFLKECINLYLFRSDLVNKKMEKLMLIPTLLVEKTSFALIDNDDYKELSREFKMNGSFSIDCYQRKLFMMTRRKGREWIKVTIVNDNESYSKSIVAIYEDRMKLNLSSYDDIDEQRRLQNQIKYRFFDF